MKTTLSLLLAVSAMAQPTVTLTAPVTRVGTPATITATLSGASGASLQFFLPQITGAKYVVTPGVLPSGKTLICGVSPTPPPALYGCIVEGGTSLLTDGVLVTITFPAPPLGSYPLPVSLQVGASTGGDSITVAAGAPLSLIVTSPCDVNGDGVVDSADVVISVQNAIARLFAATLDLTSDGVVNVVDVQRVRNAANGGVCRVGP